MGRKIYDIVQKILLGYTLYLFLLPVITPYMKKAVPLIWQCQYTKVTGKPCPFEGMTSDFKEIIQHGLNKEITNNLLSIPIFIFLIFEVFWRVFLIGDLKKVDINRVKKIIVFDIFIHLVFLIYIIFLISNFWSF